MGFSPKYSSKFVAHIALSFDSDSFCLIASHNNVALPPTWYIAWYSFGTQKYQHLVVDLKKKQRNCNFGGKSQLSLVFGDPKYDFWQEQGFWAIIESLTCSVRRYDRLVSFWCDKTTSGQAIPQFSAVAVRRRYCRHFPVVIPPLSPETVRWSDAPGYAK